MTSNSNPQNSCLKVCHLHQPPVEPEAGGLTPAVASSHSFKARVSFRRTTEEDLEMLCRILAHPEVSEGFFGSRLPAFVVQEYVERGVHLAKQPQCIQLTAIDRRSQSVIGSAMLVNQDLSYFTCPEVWGQGYGTELVRTVCCLVHQELNIDCINARILRNNDRSRRILDGLKFQFTGLGTYWICDGRWKAAMLNYRLSVFSHLT